MEEDRTRLDRVLATCGTLPPGVALEIIIELLEYVRTQGPIGKNAFRAEQLQLSPQGQLRTISTIEASSPKQDLAATGQLIFLLITGNSWLERQDDQQEQLLQFRRIATLWPGGDVLSTFVQDLLLMNVPDFDAALSIAHKLRPQVGGPSLKSWMKSADANVRKRIRPTLDDFASPDNLTGSYPAGALAHILGASRTESNVTLPPTEASQVSPAELEAMLQHLTHKTPLPHSHPSKKSMLSNAPWWFFVGITGFLLLCTAMLIVLLIR